MASDVTSASLLLISAAVLSIPMDGGLPIAIQNRAARDQSVSSTERRGRFRTAEPREVY